MYAVVTPGVVDSQVVVMVPLADEKAFLGLLENMLNLSPKLADSGEYEVRIPDVPVPVYFRFANEYVYITAVSPAGVAPAGLTAPAAFFAGGDDAIVSAQFRADRVPEELKRTILGQFELKIEEARAEVRPDETAAERQLRRLALTGLSDAVAIVLGDTEAVTARIIVDADGDGIRVEAGVSARPGSTLSRSFISPNGRTRAAAVAGMVDDPLGRATLDLALPAAYRKRFAEVVDTAIAEAVANAPGGERPIVESVLKAVAPTVKSGRVSAGLVATGPVDGKVGGLVAAVSVVEGDELAETVKAIARVVPADQVRFAFDTKTVGGYDVHTLTPSDADELETVVGSPTLRIGTSDEMVLFGAGTDVKLFDRAAAVESTAGRIFYADVDLIGLIELAEKGLSADQLADAKTTSQTGPGRPKAGSRRVRLEVRRGEQLTATLAVGGRAVAFAAAVDRIKKNAANEQSVTPPSP